MESNGKMQCWSYNNCGHEKDALCPAVNQKAGRSCWLVEKTLCGGKVHGRHTERTRSCKGCGFYIYMRTLLSRPSPANQIYNETRGKEEPLNSMHRKAR